MSKLSIIMYHYVRNLSKSRYPSIKGLELDFFRKQINFLLQNYNIVSMEDVLEDKVPPNAALLSFDDGYLDHYTNVFPILKENNIKGFFSMPGKIIRESKVLDVNKIHFILASIELEKLVQKIYERLDYYRGTEFIIDETNLELFHKLAIASRYDTEEVVFCKSLLQYYLPEQLRNLMVDDLFKEFIPITEQAFAEELYMNYDQLKLMKREGMHFGIHGYEHNWLGKLSDIEMKHDIEQALDVFSVGGVVDTSNWVMCYPYGSYNENVESYVSNSGCKLGMGTEVDLADLSKNNIYKLPRFDTNDFPPKSDNYLNYLDKENS